LRFLVVAAAVRISFQFDASTLTGFSRYEGTTFTPLL